MKKQAKIYNIEKASAELDKMAKRPLGHKLSQESLSGKGSGLGSKLMELEKEPVVWGA